MNIDKRLNLVIPYKREDGSELYVHSTPIPSPVFEQYWEVCGKTMNALLAGGYGYVAPRYAGRMLRKVAKEEGGPKPADQIASLSAVEKGFIAEIRRSTNLFVLAEKGWELRMLDEAKSSGLVDEEEAADIETAAIYFTVALRSTPKAQLGIVRGALDLWGAQISSLDCTGFRSFLTTSTADESTGVREIPS